MTSKWKLEQKVNSTELIEWINIDGGIVRARLDTIAEWETVSCPDIKDAEKAGMRIIFYQKLMREKS